MEMDRTTSMPMTEHIPASKQSLLKMREIGNPYDIATTSTAGRISFDQQEAGGSGVSPKCQGGTAKVGTRTNIRHKPDRGHIRPISST
jgi:hypothetical protein